MSKQPEALRLASLLDEPPVWESQPQVVEGWASNSPLDAAAAELRRLHSLNAELVDVLNALYVAAPISTSCAEFHHRASERHALGDECKPRADYLAALSAARATLSKAGA